MSVKTDLALNKRLDADLVGRVQDDRSSSAQLQCIISVAELGKRFKSGSSKVNVLIFEKFNGSTRRPIFPGSLKVSNRVSHVWSAHLGNDYAVGVLDHRVNDALGMNDNLNAFRFEIKASGPR